MDIVYLIIIFLLIIGFGVSIFYIHHYYEYRLRKEVYRAQKSEQLKSVFLDNASQALRTPLKAILNYSTLLLEDEEIQPEQVKEMAIHINNNTQELLGFVKQLMDLSTFEGGMPAFTFIEVNLAELMASYRRETLNITKPEVSVRIKTDLSPHCKITLDTNFMHQLMMHLLTNAANHAQKGEITIVYGYERRGLKVTITYLGNGQSDVISEDLFTYLQKDALNLTENTENLGLPICRAIIDAIGGELEIDAESGRKTVASFWFPCKMRDKHKHQ